VGITGTNGKTSTTYLLEAILDSAGHRVGVVGTVNYRVGGEAWPAPVTTPESLDLQKLLRECGRGASTSFWRSRPAWTAPDLPPSRPASPTSPRSPGLPRDLDDFSRQGPAVTEILLNGGGAEAVLNLDRHLRGGEAKVPFLRGHPRPGRSRVTTFRRGRLRQSGLPGGRAGDRIPPGGPLISNISRHTAWLTDLSGGGDRLLKGAGRLMLGPPEARSGDYAHTGAVVALAPR
jgi:hypothetical protein